MGELTLGLSFDDVLMVPRQSAVLPSEVDISSSLTSDIPMHIPMVSSAMDTVTEDELAIALAREGGIGVIHRNMGVDEQIEMVAKVKRSENTVIPDPFTVTPDITLARLQEIMNRRGVNGFPVVDGKKTLIGMVTSRDIWYVENPEATVSEVMTHQDKLVTAARTTTLPEARRILYQNRIEKLPLIDEEGKLAGLITAQDIENQQKFVNAAKDPNGQLRVGAAVGVGPDCFERAQGVIAAGVDAVFIDAATGHTTRVFEVVEQLRNEFEIPIVAGNVVTREGAESLIERGASAIKVGVGPGSICTTRVIAGVGVPQFTAILEVSEVCREKGIALIADGGVRYSGDIVKAMAAGADMVMLGSLLAGCKESPGSVVNYQGRTWKKYRGMGSVNAMKKGSGDRYGQNSSGKLVAEGVEARVPYRGPLADTIFQLLGGLRSGMGYVGAANLKELREKATFRRITPGGLKESHAHDITITEEPVNYQQSSPDRL